MKRKILFTLLVCFALTLLFATLALAEKATPPEEAAIRFEQPILITSIGQSAGAMMARVLAERAELSFVYEQRAEITALDEAKTLIVVLGVSSKGLGAARVDLDGEIAWATELLNRARELGIPIIVMHIEGRARRGALSDPIITLFAPQSDYLIVREEGNEDGLFTEISTENEIPMATAERTLDIVPILAALFPAGSERSGER